VLSVEQVGVYKPDPRVYGLAERRFGIVPGQMAFLSSNPWDAFGAKAAGFRVGWINRTHAPDEYGLRAHARELADLTGLPELLS
jgi:2-haloacid dehalogenase